MASVVTLPKRGAVAAPSPAPAGPTPLSVVEGPRGLRRFTTTVALLLVAFVVAAMFGMAYFHHRLAEGQYELRDLEQHLAGLEARRVEAEIEVERLSSPQRIADAAAGLGMVVPQQVTDLAVVAP